VTVKIGTGPDSWGVWFGSDALQTPWQRCLDEMAEAGYKYAETGPPGYIPGSPADIKKEFDRRNLLCPAGFIMRHYEDDDERGLIREDVELMGNLLSTLGAEYIILIDDTYTDLANGKQLRPADLNESDFGRFIENIALIGEDVSKRFGLRAVFHPHADTRIEHEEQIERFVEAMPPEFVGICLDTGHHAYCGGDPVAFMRKFFKRIEYLHLKSVDKDIRERVKRNNLPFARAVAEGVFVEPALGIVDFEAFKDVLNAVQFDGFAVVEQDMYPCKFDKPLPIARRTYDWLMDNGF